MKLNIKMLRGYNTITFLNGVRVNNFKDLNKKFGIWKIIKMFFNSKPDVLNIKILYKKDEIGNITMEF